MLIASLLAVQIITEAYGEFKKDQQLESCSEQEGLQRFFNTPPNVRHGTTAYISKSVINSLLDGDLRTLADNMCAVM